MEKQLLWKVVKVAVIIFVSAIMLGSFFVPLFSGNTQASNPQAQIEQKINEAAKQWAEANIQIQKYQPVVLKAQEDKKNAEQTVSSFLVPAQR